MRKRLQEIDDGLTKATNSPPARFVERGGPTIVGTVGRTIPLAQEWSCPREDCQQYWSRRILAKDAEEEALGLIDGKGENPGRAPKDNRALP